MVFSPGPQCRTKEENVFMTHKLIYINQTICWLFEYRMSYFVYWPQGQQSHTADARILLSCLYSEMTIGSSLSVFRSASFGNLLSSNNNVLRKLSGTLNYSLIPKFKLCKLKKLKINALLKSLEIINEISLYCSS